MAQHSCIIKMGNEGSLGTIMDASWSKVSGLRIGRLGE